MLSVCQKRVFSWTSKNLGPRHPEFTTCCQLRLPRVSCGEAQQLASMAPRRWDCPWKRCFTQGGLSPPPSRILSVLLTYFPKTFEKHHCTHFPEVLRAIKFRDRNWSRGGAHGVGGLGAWGRGNWGLAVSRFGAPVWEDERFGRQMRVRVAQQCDRA